MNYDLEAARLKKDWAENPRWKGVERGYSAEDCRKILGGNLLRVFKEVEQVSKQLQAENRPRITDRQPFDKPQK